MKKLSGLNDIYNFPDTIILCEIFEKRANQMMNSSHIILENVHQLVHSVIVSIDFFQRRLLRFQQKLKLLIYSNKHKLVDSVV